MVLHSSSALFQDNADSYTCNLFPVRIRIPGLEKLQDTKVTDQRVYYLRKDMSYFLSNFKFSLSSVSVTCLLVASCLLAYAYCTLISLFLEGRRMGSICVINKTHNKQKKCIR